ncbi:MAG: DUF2911 domain-containing protein [Bacteroidia bacterium]|nr:DUF2911 domain-containing protein [Bacteroidia bacterium]
MKQVLLTLVTFITITACSQGGNRPSPASTAKATLDNGANISISYSQPSVKGRTIGTDLEPMPGKVWRTGANEATVFETDKDIKVEGQPLAAGKYGLFTIMNGDEWTIIFNKTWNQWGAFRYKDTDDVLRVKVKSVKADPFAEKMSFSIQNSGKISLMWGAIQVDFKVE